MTKIQLKKIYSKIFSYNRNEVREYNSLEEMAKNLESKYTLKHKEIKGDKIYYNEFIVNTYEKNNKFSVGNITYYTKNNQTRELF